MSFRLISRHHGMQVRDLQRLVNYRRYFAEFQATAVVTQPAEDTHEKTEAGAVDEVHIGQMQDDPFLRKQRIIDFMLQSLNFRARHNPPLATDHYDVFQNLTS